MVFVPDKARKGAQWKNDGSGFKHPRSTALYMHTVNPDRFLLLAWHVLVCRMSYTSVSNSL